MGILTPLDKVEHDHWVSPNGSRSLFFDYLTPDQVALYEQPETLDFPPAVGTDYTAYIHALFQTDSETPGSRVLYPLNDAPINVQQTRLHLAALRLRAKIRTSRYGDHHLMLELVSRVASG